MTADIYGACASHNFSFNFSDLFIGYVSYLTCTQKTIEINNVALWPHHCFLADVIDVRELAFVLRCVKDEAGLDESEIEELIHEVDKNHDGFIDYDEFQDMVSI